MKTEMKKAIERIKAMFTEFNGASLIGVREYTNRNNETANHVVNANCSYPNACANSKEILDSLTSKDFETIAKMYGVNNEEGIKYATSEPARLFLEENKHPKIETKAYQKMLKGVHTTKSLATIRDEMSMKFDLENREETPQMIAQKEAYIRITKSMKLCLETGNVHIHAYAFAKEILTEGEYKDSTPKPETVQKNAITRYCKEVLKQELPTTRYRNFIVTEGELGEVAVDGEVIRVTDK